jgi:hypothetical protein
MNTIQATGPGGVAALRTAASSSSSNGAAITGDIISDMDKGSLAHAVLMVLATLVAAPLDIITASALRRWPVLHIITSSMFQLLIFIGMGLGIYVSREYILVSGPPLVRHVESWRDPNPPRRSPSPSTRPIRSLASSLSPSWLYSSPWVWAIE